MIRLDPAHGYSVQSFSEERPALASSVLSDPHEQVAEHAQVGMGHDPPLGTVMNRFHPQDTLHGAKRPLGPPHVSVSQDEFFGRKIKLVGHEHIFAVEALIRPDLAPVDGKSPTLGLPQVSGVSLSGQQLASLPGMCAGRSRPFELGFESSDDLPTDSPVRPVLADGTQTAWLPGPQ